MAISTKFFNSLSNNNPGFGLSCLDFDGGTILVPRIDLPPATRLRVRVAAKDISLALTAPKNSSVLNVFHGTVQNIIEGPRSLR